MALAAGCASLTPRAKTPAVAWTERQVGPFIVECSGGAAAMAEPVVWLEELEERLDQQLGLTIEDGTPPIRVLIFDDQQQLTRLMSSAHPDLPTRRAFFLAEAESRTIYACRGDRLREDLQHEATHALLHATVGALPLWLDEGLAEYFEVGPGDEKEVRRRIETLMAERREGWSPDLERLESVDSIRDMTSLDYREAWAWARLMLEGHTTKRQAVVAALRLSGPARDDVRLVSHQLGVEGPDLERTFWESLDLSKVQPAAQLRTQSPDDRQPLARPPSMLGRVIGRINSAIFGR